MVKIKDAWSKNEKMTKESTEISDNRVLMQESE